MNRRGFLRLAAALPLVGPLAALAPRAAPKVPQAVDATNTYRAMDGVRQTTEYRSYLNTLFTNTARTTRFIVDADGALVK